MDIKELHSLLKNIIKVGTVSSVDAVNCTVKVEFDDKDGAVSGDLMPFNRGSKAVKDYWLPDVGEQVSCLLLPNDKNLSTGWILGSYFSEKAPPNAADANIRRIDFGDGSFIEYDRGSGTMNINCIGNININGATVNIN